MALQPVLTVQSTGGPLLAPVFLFACWRTFRIGLTTPIRLRSPHRSFSVDPLSCYVSGEIVFRRMPSTRT